VNDNIVLWDATSAGSGYNVNNKFRNSNAKYFLPSENEWYKAAYYSGTGSTYYDYATGDSVPTAVASGTSGAVYNGQSGPADITSAGGLSPYGTMGQGGNAWEWMETEYDGVNDSSGSSRGLRGGSWGNNVGSLVSSGRGNPAPSLENLGIGFRVASSELAAVPEPTSLLSTLALVSSGLLLRRRGKVSL
jgi:formylglycine-generating enzyme required for sulfatase activity